jgi:hypothetical protein
MRLTFGQTVAFDAQWRRLRLTDEDLQALESLIMERPEAGVVMQGTGGLRKIRFAPPSWHTGKSGATRVCYVAYTEFGHCLLVELFAKNEKVNLSAAGKMAARRAVEAFRRRLLSERS